MRRLILIAAALLSAAGCSMGQDKAAAEAAVAEFHRMADAGQFREIYAASASELKGVTSEEQLTGLLQSIRERLGQTRQSDQQGWHVNINNGVSMVNLTYNTQFANGRATENFNYRIDNGRAALVGYNINQTDAPAAPPAGGTQESAAPAGDGSKPTG